jgi:hypothetical protein
MASIAPVRPSALAGTWYEGNPRALARAVDQYLDRAELPELPGDVVAIMPVTSTPGRWPGMPLQPYAGRLPTWSPCYRQCTNLITNPC